jgi:hypothetical protein
MKPPSTLRLFLNGCIAALLAAQSAHAAIKYWDGDSVPKGWDNKANWSTAAGDTTPNPSAVPGISDIAHFNISTANSAQVVHLNTNQSAAGLVFANTFTTTLQGGTELGKTRFSHWAQAASSSTVAREM